MSLQERFHRIGWAVTESGCHEWRGYRRPTGYGAIGLGSRAEGTEYAHRVAWTLMHGPIPAGMFVCHHCDNRACVNVEHLFLGSNRDNVRDMVSKGRENPHGRSKTHCRRGHEFTPANTYLNRGRRHCRECGRLKSSAYRARRHGTA